MRKKETETKLNDGFDIKKKTKVVSLEETPKPKAKRKRRTKVDKVESIEYVSNDNQTLTFIPSKYQQAIFDFISHGVGNAVINATAGSGKTSTLVNALRLINSDLSVLFIAFNKDIVTELKKKIGSDLQNVTVSTVHSIGFSMLRRNFFGNNFTVDQFKYKTYIKKHLSALTTMDLFNFSKSKKANYLDNIITLVDLGRCYLAQSDKELVKIADTYGIDLIGDETQVVLNVLEWGSTNLDTIDFGDMVWLPYELDLQPKGLQYDFVFCDECQDISDVQRELFLRCFKKGTRFVGIGDEKQCQPAGTRILMYDGLEKNIEDIKVGDKVVTYSVKSNCCFKGYQNLSKGGNVHDRYADTVIAINNRKVDNTVKITTSNNLVNEYSLDHICYAKFNREKCENAYALYLMCNDRGMFRIGKTKLFNVRSKNTFGVKARMRSEKCNKAWVLKIYDNDKEAKMDEIYYSYKFRIPQIIFSQERTGSFFISDSDVIELYNRIGNMFNNAIECLTYFNKMYEHPFCINNNADKHSREYLSEYNACNLFEGYMDVITFDETNVSIRKHGNNCKQDKIIRGTYVNIDKLEYLSDTKTVYSIEVENNHNYVANNIVTHNCIYGFNGANSLSFKNLQNLPNTINLPLSITYRCPKKVVNYVKKYVPEIEARSDAPEGEIVYDVKIKDVEDNSMVLCRNKMPLVMLYMRYLRMGKQAYIRGKDIGLNLINMINCTDKELLNQDMKADGVFVRLYENLFDTRNRLMAKRGLDIKDATLSDSVISQYDSIKALEVLSEGLQTANELRLRIQTVFREDKLGICLSTIHKAKGLEADNVYIACRSLMPSMMAEQEWELQQEDNLQYVAYTRTKYKLGFISEKELSPMAGLIEVNSTLKDLSYIETIVCRILKKVAINPMDSAEMGKLQISNSTPLEKPKVNVASLTSESEDDEDNDDSFDEMMKLLKEKGGLKKLKEFLKS